jgi:hypothetical protein
MKALRPWFTACFFWLPLVIALLLNPGRNASNIHSFSSPALLALAACGLCMVFYSFVGFIQLKVFGFAYGSGSLAATRTALLVFALALGSIAIYSAWQGT